MFTPIFGLPCRPLHPLEMRPTRLSCWRKFSRLCSPLRTKSYVDGTFGAGGYTRAILERADCRVVAIDRDPAAIARGGAMKEEVWRTPDAGARALQRHGRCMRAAWALPPVNGVVLDIGVSSMQIDEPLRGFSFLRDGPLDMRMSGEGHERCRCGE